MTWPGIVLWLLILYGAFSRGPMMIYLFSATAIFGGLTMLPLQLTGGLNLLPQTICAAFIVGKAMMRKEQRDIVLGLALNMRKLGVLTLFLLYAALSSILFPRLFEGQVMLFSLNAAASESPLAPTSANFSQIIYLGISIGILFSFAAACRNAAFRRHYFNSILLTGILLCASGGLDLALTTAGHSSWLSSFHNAGYNLLTDQELGGETRVVGFMPEASVFGETCCFILAFLMFNYGAYSRGLRRLLLPLTMAALVAITFLSTSSTGYAGLGAIGGLFFLRLTARFFLAAGHGKVRSQGLFLGICGVAVIVILFSVATASQFSHYESVLNAAVFDKTSSGSYVERSSWTDAGIAAFFATHGIGVGVGSIRTSNWFVNILASTGIIGVLLLGLAVLNILWPRRLPADMRRLAGGLKLCILPAALMIGISGTTPDPGVWIASICGVIFALSYQFSPAMGDLPQARQNDYGSEARMPLPVDNARTV